MMENSQVLEHLLFHKAIIDEGERSLKIDRYMSILDDGGDEIPRDLVDHSIRQAFDLVLSHGLDPWEIDLLEFTRMYAEKARSDAIDFIVAGKLVHMAWSILRMQSQEVLQQHDRVETFFCDWDVEGFDCLLPDQEWVPELELPDDLDMGGVVRHPAIRPVSLIELLDAFDDARVEVEISLARQAARERRPKNAGGFDDKAHEDDLERDVEEIWNRIDRLGAGPIRFQDLCDNTRDDIIKTFVAILHLARDGRISLRQENFPAGEITVEVKVAWDIGMIHAADESSAQPVVIRDRDMVV